MSLIQCEDQIIALYNYTLLLLLSLYDVVYKNMMGEKKELVLVI